jgi:4-amino-4-deoxy-L-arabinose transferase-like glycosyltransferase
MRREPLLTRCTGSSSARTKHFSRVALKSAARWRRREILLSVPCVSAPRAPLPVNPPPAGGMFVSESFRFNAACPGAPAGRRDVRLIFFCLRPASLFPMSNHFALSAEPPPETTLAASPVKAWTLLLLVFLAVQFATLFSPSLLDDADSTHANAARHMALSGDWVTLKVNGIRYLEKPPLPYWLTAVDYRIFGYNVFATHLPLALAVLALAALAWVWGRRAYGDRAAFYAALGILTSIGVFLFTRIFIPEVLLTLLLGLALYAFLTGLEDKKPERQYIAWSALALAVLAKGLIAPVFVFAALIPYLLLTGDWRRWRELHLVTGFLLFLAIAAPWHILAGLRNPDQGHPSGNIPSPDNVHGFFYFYFINEHFLRFLNKRYPDDYNKLPALLYWSLHLVWLFPSSLFLPVVLRRAWMSRARWRQSLRPGWGKNRYAALRESENFRRKSNLLLAIYAAVILVFFSISTNQEYYTFPAYFPLLLITAGALAAAERALLEGADRGLGLWLNAIQAAFAMLGVAAAVALGYGLWSSRKLPFVPDIGTLLADRDVAGYTFSMSHFFDLTAASFAALRLPATLAAAALLLGPAIAWSLRRKRHDFEATVSVAFTSAVFLIAAHIALVRFEPMLSSRAMADTINGLVGLPDGDSAAGQKATLILYGDQSYGSSIPFYTHRPVLLVNGRVAAMLWGSNYPDAPHIFLNDQDLLALWGTGPRNFLFVPVDQRAHVASLLGQRGYLIEELAGKALYTDRPLTGRPAG